MNTPPKNYLVESILVTIFCCLPFGIAGIVFAAQVNTKFDAGDFQGAEIASQNAKKWMKWGIISSIIVVLLYVLFAVLLGGTALLANFE